MKDLSYDYIIFKPMAEINSSSTARAAEFPGGARPYASDVSYGPYGAPVSDAGISLGNTGPFEGVDSR